MIKAIMEKNREMIEALIATRKPAQLIILQEGDPVPEAVKGQQVLYVLEVASPFMKEIATSEAEVDMKPMTRRSPALQNPQMN